jgi:hypothetical protein
MIFWDFSHLSTVNGAFTTTIIFIYIFFVNQTKSEVPGRFHSMANRHLPSLAELSDNANRTATTEKRFCKKDVPRSTDFGSACQRLAASTMQAKTVIFHAVCG